MGATKDMLMEEMYWTPKLDGESELVRAMVEWFLSEFEDPVESCSVDGGVYEYIWGGPIDDEASELAAQFPDADDLSVQRAAGILQTSPSAGSWARKPGEDQ